MGLLDNVAATRRRIGRKGWSDRPVWDLDRIARTVYDTSPYSRDERTAADFEALAEDVYKANGPVSALMNVRMAIFAEARFQFRQLVNGRPGDLFGTAALALLEQPWANATTGDLLARMIQDADLAGNCYLTVVNGHVRRLRPDWVTIISGSRSEPDLPGGALDAELIGYLYSPRMPGSGSGVGGETDGTLLLPSQVAHFAPIPDPLANWRGMSWLTPVLREVSADSAATLHKLKFFENGASPRFVASVDPSVPPETFARFKALMDEGHQGAMNAYKTIYLGGGADVKVVGADLQQLDFKATQGAGESRLAAAAGVPSVIVGFSEGLQGSSLNAGNYAASRRRFADGTLRPLWRNAAGSLATLVPPPPGSMLWYDDRDIAFLREDRADVAAIQNQQANTIAQLVAAGYEPASVVAAVEAEDYRLLKHTGLYSVQLQPPGVVAPVAGAPNPPAGS